MKRIICYDKKGRLIYSAKRADDDKDFVESDLDECISLCKVKKHQCKIFICNNNEDTIQQFEDSRKNNMQSFWDGTVITSEDVSKWKTETEKDYPGRKK